MVNGGFKMSRSEQGVGVGGKEPKMSRSGNEKKQVEVNGSR